MLSVITITYNNFEELKETIKSLGSFKNMESIIVNGGQCQKTKKFLKGYNGITISEPDKGISDAFNKGVEAATGKYIVFLNSGDKLIDKNYYSNAIEVFSNDPNIDYIYADVNFEHSIHGLIRVYPKFPPNGKMPFMHLSLITRKEIFRDIGDFDLNFKIAMDFDWVYRMISRNYKGFYYRKAPVVYMNGEGISSNNAIQGLKERIKALRKNKMLSLKEGAYLGNLWLKSIARNILAYIGLLSFYDKIRSKYRKTH
ncbi:glycosyltransferase [Bacteriovoracales bacterium]|nr:glycosyltransferase [Bacteriovoracales bacterium]